MWLSCFHSHPLAFLVWKNYSATDFQYIASHSSSFGAHAKVDQTAGAIGLWMLDV